MVVLCYCWSHLVRLICHCGSTAIRQQGLRLLGLPMFKASTMHHRIQELVGKTDLPIQDDSKRSLKATRRRKKCFEVVCDPLSSHIYSPLTSPNGIRLTQSSTFSQHCPDQNFCLPGTLSLQCTLQDGEREATICSFHLITLVAVFTSHIHCLELL